MLSYRHAFHAGNFADVLKHLVLLECLYYLKQKEKPFAYYDTHAGPGLYALDSAEARKTGEHAEGIGRIWAVPELPEALADYRSEISRFNPGPLLRKYPGSPALAASLLRPQDRLFLCELHPADSAALQSHFSQDPRATLLRADGFARTLKWLPPRERRGLILIDPSYEIKEDYQQVADFLTAAHRTFSTGIYLLWYPVIERDPIDGLRRSLENSGIRKIERYELGIRPDTEGRGMTGSGLIVINPPWTLRSRLGPTLQALPQLLGASQGYHVCETWVGE